MLTLTPGPISLRPLSAGVTPMMLVRLIVAAGIAAGLATAALFADAAAPPAARMADAAAKILASLPADLRAQAKFDFDSPERVNWHFVPLQDKERKPTRKGLRLELMDDAQKAATLELVRAGLSDAGYEQAGTIMSLENVLAGLEKPGGNVRSPGWYFLSVYGEPAKSGRWGWRVEGHHLSMNFTLDGGRIVSATPSFFGCNPADVKAGPRQGLRAMPAVEDLAKELFLSLDADQKALALQPKQFPEVSAQNAAVKPGPPVGLPASKLTEAQRATLGRLLEAYAGRLTAEAAQAELEAMRASGPDAVYFGWAGDPAAGKPHSYRVQGPAFVVEFLNIQADAANNPANHIHSSLRRLPADFGMSKN